ncbi:glycosyltransferase [Pseudoalteromonas lipolytica]|uniref:Glycosyltransferase involved in cell wall bisynthesis n=1 Tax=Pseudoalteromonas lipolytica TaxID=570156 RepID=A0ABY1GLQ4_9GAMM|nr:glycosyltransferase [Pseudoalteromonas lipolytica]MBE0349644.1 hypothetical protein [Pseudoalteromonas lipolytica LMEB 39]SFT78477.1 Glycosyltransferase involved in cell wall bisynthesis [Pseudoalteromonas lipolytica]
MKTKLVVVGEPEVVPFAGCRNNALNEILKKYTLYNDSVTYYSSASSPEDYELNGVKYQGFPVYSKNNRLILKNSKKIRETFKKYFLCGDNYHIQFRIPSIFTLQIYFIVKDLLRDGSYSFYMAGDWVESLRFNHASKFFLLKHLDKIQRILIKNKKVVFTGHALMRKYSNLIFNGHPFYSTTHSFSDVQISYDKSDNLGICFIGRIEPLKNFSFVVSLAESKKLKHYTFHFLGDGPKMEELTLMVKEKGLDNIRVHGHIKDRNLFNHIVSSCKYFVLPSYTEGTSKTLPEMMCRSIVPIAFDGVGGNNEILKEAGILIPVDDTEAAVENILRIDANPTNYKELIDEGYKYAKQNTIENQLELMFNFMYKNQ